MLYEFEYERNRYRKHNKSKSNKRQCVHNAASNSTNNNKHELQISMRMHIYKRSLKGSGEDECANLLLQERLTDLVGLKRARQS